MRLTGEWLRAEGLQRVLALASLPDAPALLVGGSVRDAVQGRAVGDMDIATPMLPETVMARAQEAGLKAVPTGIAHGTVTVVAGGVPHEVTTFRRDVETTGRHATVAFTTELAEDAARRDFTMNALYADAAGNVLDPTGDGIADAIAGRVRFIGDAEERIREDYLRILRFFRFSATRGTGPLDVAGLTASAALAGGLGQLSAERVTVEMCKLLGAAAPAEVLVQMAGAGVLDRVLPMAQVRHLAALETAEAGLPPTWTRRLLALGGRWQGWRLPKVDIRRIEAMERALARAEAPALRGEALGQDDALDVLAVEAAILGVEIAPDAGVEVSRGADARFPLTAADLMPPFAPGPALGTELARLRQVWRDGGLRATRDELLAARRAP